MIKGYYIVPDMRSSEIGVNKKFQYHVNEFGKISDVEMIRVPENKNITRIMMRLPVGNSGCDYTAVYSKILNPNYIYIRKKDFDAKLFSFMSKIKNNYPDCKILLEIPTFPYDKDGLNKWYNIFIILKDRFYRKKVQRYVDRIVTYSDDETIFGCKTIKAHNGVDCSRITPVQDYSLETNMVRLIAVAQFRQHHGYERLIQGMGLYYKKKHDKKVILYMVGNGSERALYEKTAKDFGVEEYVYFLGSMQGNELDAQYEKSDIAVSSLGMYKLGLKNVSTLKNCEYISKGLPIITAYHDYILDGLNTVLTMPNDSSPICIDDIISFYDQVYRNGKKAVIESNRKVAIERADLSQCYKDVLKFIIETANNK